MIKTTEARVREEPAGSLRQLGEELTVARKLKEISLMVNLAEINVHMGQVQVYEIIEGYLKETGKVYRGYHFETEEERRQFLRQTKTEGLKPKGTKADMSLTAFLHFATIYAHGNGVVFEIDESKISWRTIDYAGNEPTSHMFAAEMRSPHVPPEAITGTHLIQGPLVHNIETAAVLLSQVYENVTSNQLLEIRRNFT